MPNVANVVDVEEGVCAGICEVEVMGKEVAVSSDGLFDVGNTKSDSDDEGDLF